MLRALGVEGNIKRSGQTDTGPDIRRRCSGKGCNRNAPLRPPIVKTGSLIVACMSDGRMTGGTSRKPGWRTARDEQSRERGKDNRDPNPHGWPHRSQQCALQNTMSILSLDHSSSAFSIISLDATFRLAMHAE